MGDAGAGGFFATRICRILRSEFGRFLGVCDPAGAAGPTPSRESPGRFQTATEPQAGGPGNLRGIGVFSEGKLGVCPGQSALWQAEYADEQETSLVRER